ncbi:hypothetical protein [Marinomonas colpomeniae]|jgi:signal transduction histidine kinase|uniref:Uncharacterized protein n=1 Tax=Marinomonas colpomeniae TaxID=2774408 RepID=A0ABR8NZP7_9GAMM|nr:hypothetical protein [Marinomonas colpomeniae]MBD5770964.1 hypothetical protein [Marinomonas colpomeniae]
MGIVVTVFMALILFLSVPGPVERTLKKFQYSIFLVAFLLGAWNAFWYGAQHIYDFWGMAAMISGLLMMLTSLSNVSLKGSPIFIKNTFGWLQSKVNSLPQGFNELTLLMLLGCVGIYGYTLISLNLQ